MLKKMKLALLGALAVTVGVVAYSQQKSKECKMQIEQNLQYEVVVQLTNARVTSIVVKEGDNEETIVDYQDNHWNRSFSGDLPVRVSVKGQAAQGNDSSAKMTIEVLKDGVLYRNAIAQGPNLEANVSF
ncbi:hypothetical protein HX004_04815 [Myroides sp. 1354]|uniref:hypothetical protein n=1 Tax=unclassified Myroides TaxID=2642485 RepID=UPI002578DFD6|nr:MULTISPECIES: hypothetical protein [unclassified Myroides]MDM1044165.1 hypothetical protein [Myroides sp. R163-1]MDM1055101.1 hypothetical protein [Myroides sp. 1354]MDM1068398.1 hypothetical protein [Myroides sp. 1372]